MHPKGMGQFFVVLLLLSVAALATCSAISFDAQWEHSMLSDRTWVEVIEGKLSFSWNVIAGDTERLEFGIRVEGDFYGSFGVSASTMDGPIVACYAPIANVSAGMCMNCLGAKFNVKPATNETTTMSMSREGSVTTFIGQVPSATMQLVNESQRIIFAYGPWQGGKKLPGLHQRNATAEMQINLYLPPNINPTTTEAPETSTLAPATWVEVIKGKLSFSWVVIPGSTEMLEFGIRVEGDFYGSFGVSDSAMDGPIVACYAPVTHAELGTCVNCLGENFNVKSAALVTETFSISREGSTTTMLGRIPTKSMNVRDEKQRIIFAVGPWQKGAELPGMHGFGETAILSANFYTNTVSILTNDHLWARIGFGIATVLTGGIVLLGFLTNRIIEHVWSPRMDTLFTVCGIVFILAMCAMIEVISVKDYQHTMQSAPHGRALSVAALFPFCLLFVPVLKHFPGLPFWWATSWERLVPTHIFLACLMFVLATAHFAVMAVDLIKDMQSFKWFFSFNTEHYIIFAFFFWIAVLIMGITGLLFRRCCYSFFRLTHLLFVVAVACIWIHSQAALESLCLPLLIFIIDYVQRIVTHFRAKAKLESAFFDSAAGVITLRIKMNGQRPPAGSHVLLGFGSLSILTHPFDVASFDDGVATIYIKTKSSNTWTGQLATKVVKGSHLGGLVFMGPYGDLTVPIATCKSVVFIAGGIGISLMLNLLQEVAEGRSVANRVTVVWVLSNPNLMKVMGPMFKSRIEDIGDAPGVIIRVKAVVHLAGMSKDGDPPRRSVRAEVNEDATERTRLIPAEAETHPREVSKFDTSDGDITTIETRPNLQEYIGNALNDASNDPSDVAVYVSGPESLIDETYSIAKRLGTHFHAESYEV